VNLHSLVYLLDPQLGEHLLSETQFKITFMQNHSKECGRRTRDTGARADLVIYETQVRVLFKPRILIDAIKKVIWLNCTTKLSRLTTADTTLVLICSRAI